MIDIGKLLKRAWQILWNYRTLWIFAFLLAITAGGGGGSNFNFGNISTDQKERPSFPSGGESSNPQVRELMDWARQNLLPLVEQPQEHLATIIWIAVGAFLFLLVIGVALTIVRYVSETAVLRMVDNYEATGEKVGFKAGWKLGWSRRAFRAWVVDLILSLPLFVFLGFLMALIALLVVGAQADGGVAVATTIAALGCTFLFVFFFILFLVFLSLLRHFFVRAVALEDTGIGAAFRRGWTLFKRNWKSIGLVWLVMLGIGIGFSLVSIIVFLVLIPVYLVLAIPAAIISFIPGLIAFGIASLFLPTLAAWVVALIAIAPLFLIITFAPVVLLSGLFFVFDSIVWTLTYREVVAVTDMPATGEPGPTLEGAAA